MVIALQTVFDRRWLLELNICPGSMWWSRFLQTKLNVYPLLKSANRVREIPSHLSHQIKGHNGFQRVFPLTQKAFWKLLPLQKRKKEKKKRKKGKKQEKKRKKLEQLRQIAWNMRTSQYLLLFIMFVFGSWSTNRKLLVWYQRRDWYSERWFSDV